MQAGKTALDTYHAERVNEQWPPQSPATPTRFELNICPPCGGGALPHLPALPFGDRLENIAKLDFSKASRSSYFSTAEPGVSNVQFSNLLPSRRQGRPEPLVFLIIAHTEREVAKIVGSGWLTIRSESVEREAQRREFDPHYAAASNG